MKLFLHLLKIMSNGKSSWSFTRTGFMKHCEQLNLIGLGYIWGKIIPVNWFLLSSMLQIHLQKDDWR